MEAIMLVAESPDLLPDFRETLRAVFPAALISELSDNLTGFSIELSSRSRIYIDFDGENLASIGWDDFEIELITQKFQSIHYVYSIAYHNIEAVKKVIVSLADSDDVMVDNDAGDLLLGTELVQKIRANPNWNWLQDFAEQGT